MVSNDSPFSFKKIRELGFDKNRNRSRNRQQEWTLDMMSLLLDCG